MKGVGLSLLLPVLGTVLGCRLILATPRRGALWVGRILDALPERAEKALLSPRLDIDLQLAGSPLDSTRFRARQIAFGALGAVAAGVVVSGALGNAGWWAGTSGGFGLRQALVVSLGGAIVPVASYELWIRHRAERARDRAAGELANMADLLCIAISAGESVRSALALVAGLMSVPLRSELESVVADVAAGIAFDEAISRMADRIDRPAAAVMAETLSRAHERGMGLADQLRALAREVRQDQRAAVVESMGRRQMLMIVPVVFLILPTALAFAALPGFYTLQLAVG